MVDSSMNTNGIHVETGMKAEATVIKAERSAKMDASSNGFDTFTLLSGLVRSICSRVTIRVLRFEWAGATEANKRLFSSSSGA